MHNERFGSNDGGNNGLANGAGLPPQGANVPSLDQKDGAEQLKLETTNLLPRVNKAQLQTVALDAIPQLTRVQSLEVRRLKGLGALFTPNLAQARSSLGLAYRAEGKFDEVYQLLAGELRDNPRIVARAKVINFVPAVAWQTGEVVIVPYKMSPSNSRVLQNFRDLVPRFPNYKVASEWDDSKRRHEVYVNSLAPHEQKLISRIVWPTIEQLHDALQRISFDNVSELAAANAEIRLLLQSEVME